MQQVLEYSAQTRPARRAALVEFLFRNPLAMLAPLLLLPLVILFV